MPLEAIAAAPGYAGTQRPLLRGWSHLGATVAATAGAVWLLLIADSPSAYVGAAIFSASLILLYGTSASYHRIRWRPTLQRLLRRLDHGMIFVLIAGTYTPLCLKISLAWGIPILSVVWGIAGAGVILRLIWLGGPRWLRVALYVILGWVALVGISELVQEFAPGPLAMLAIGGLLYTLGGAVYAVRRPDPWPRVFGYHEVFHLFVIAGSAVHYSVIAAFVLPG
jgi:hemolysin III